MNEDIGTNKLEPIRVSAMLHVRNAPLPTSVLAERVGCVTPCLLGILVVRDVVGSHPSRGNSTESFSSNQDALL